MKRVLLLLVVCLLSPQLSIGAPGDREVVVSYTPVPAYPPYQGEVRVLRRAGASVVQTLLYSKVMRWVVAAIRKKEQKGWPPEREGAADSKRYLQELAQAYESLRERARERQKAGDRDRHLQLAIEFFLEGEHGYVAFFEPGLTREGDRLVLHKKELLKKLTLSRGYVHRNMQLIVEDSFRLEADEARELLRQAAGG